MYHICTQVVYNCALPHPHFLAIKRTGAARKRRSPGAASSLNKHQQRTEATKRKLLKAALRIFARDGFEAASIDEIAIEAGYTRGAFYAHFQSKEDLFFAMLEDESHKHFEALTKMMEKLESKRERLDALREHYVSRVADRRWSILILEFKLYALRHPKLRARLAGMHRSIKSKMKWGDIGRIWDTRSEHTAEAKEFVRITLQIMLNGLVLERAYDPASISDTQVASLLRQLFDFMTDTQHFSAAGPRKKPR